MQDNALWIIRHGERVDDVQPLWAKSAERPFDPPLTQEGHRQAQETSKKIQNHLKEAPVILFSSPFLRCLETSAHIAKSLNIPIHIEFGLSEWLKLGWFSSLPTFPLQSGDNIVQT